MSAPCLARLPAPGFHCFIFTLPFLCRVTLIASTMFIISDLSSSDSMAYPRFSPFSSSSNTATNTGTDLLLRHALAPFGPGFGSPTD